MQIKKLLSLFITFLLFQTSFADEFGPGIVYLCAPDRNLFSLTSIYEINPDRIGNDSIYTAIPLSGHGRVDSSTDLKCAIGTTVITAGVSIDPPRPTGACGGVTHITLTSLKINGKNITENVLPFNDDCQGWSVIDIEIKVIDDDVFTKICHQEVGDDIRYKMIHCNTISK